MSIDTKNCYERSDKLACFEPSRGQLLDAVSGRMGPTYSFVFGQLREKIDKFSSKIERCFRDELRKWRPE
jgi:hypothetical protein